jgi:hypothetical protein
MRNPATDAATRRALLARYHVRWVLDVPGEASVEAGRAPVATRPQGQRLYPAG